MAVQAARVTVTTTPTRLDTPSTDGRPGASILIRCPAATIYIGGPTVTAANGYELPPGDSFSFDIDESGLRGDSLYAVVSSGTAPVFTLRTGV